MAYDKKNKQILKEEIIYQVSIGNSLKAVLDSDNDMPTRPTVYSWLNSEHKDYDKIFFNNYTGARDSRAELMFEEIKTIADNQEDDVYISEDGAEVTNHNVIQRARLRVDTRKWMLGKMQPKKYGDKLDLGLSIKIPLKGITFDKE